MDKSTNLATEYCEAYVKACNGSIFIDSGNGIIEISVNLDEEKEEKCYLFFGDKRYEDRGYVPLGVEGVEYIEMGPPVREDLSHLYSYFKGTSGYFMTYKTEHNLYKLTGVEYYDTYLNKSIYLLKKGKDDDHYTIADVFSGWVHPKIK